MNNPNPAPVEGVVETGRPSMKVSDRRSSAVAERRPEAGAIDTSPPAVIARALAQGTPIADLKELMAMQERWEANQARKAFAVAMAFAKREAPTINKDKHVSFQTSKGTTEYDHATIGNVVGKIVPWLAQHGFTHRWDTKQEPNKVTVTCVITHESGHSESVTLFAAHDESGGKNSIQALISTKSYLERHTLTGAAGLATRDQEDDDGRAGGRTEDYSKLTDAHQAEIRKTCEEVGPTILGNVLREYKVTALADIRDSCYGEISLILANMKKKRQATAGAK